MFERFMIKDADGYISTSKAYVRENKDLLVYTGYTKVNSTVIHIYEFIPPF